MCSFVSFVVKNLRCFYFLWTRFPFTQEHLDFFQKRGKEVFFLQARGNVFAAINRTITGHDDYRNVGRKKRNRLRLCRCNLAL